MFLSIKTFIFYFPSLSTKFNYFINIIIINLYITYISKCSYFIFTDEHYCEECSSEFGCAVCDERKTCYYKQLARKEQECERLKHDNDYEVGALEKTIYNLKAEYSKLKQAFAEIKEIANICSFTDSSELLLSRIGQILQLINECEVDL